MVTWMNVTARAWLIVGVFGLGGVVACDGDKETSGEDSDDASSQEDLSTSSTPDSTSASGGTSDSMSTSTISGDSTSLQESECAMAMATGTEVGDIVPDISLLGQDGNMHS